MMRKSLDLTGQRFGKLVVLRLAESVYHPSGKRGWMWECACDCGTTKAISQNSLRAGRSQSCSRWCRRVRTRSGLRSHPEYSTWAQMVQRCENPAAKQYCNYGGRGITVCARWRRGDGEKGGFKCFLEDMGPRPEGFSVDRIDVNGNYEPGNCRWATTAQQCQNKRNTIYVDIGGVSVPMSRYAARIGVSYKHLHHRRANGTPARIAAREALRAGR